MSDDIQESGAGDQRLRRHAGWLIPVALAMVLPAALPSAIAEPTAPLPRAGDGAKDGQ